MIKKKAKLTPAEQHRRFIEKARELGVDETENGQEAALGKVGLGATPRKAPDKKPKR